MVNLTKKAEIRLILVTVIMRNFGNSKLTAKTFKTPLDSSEGTNNNDKMSGGSFIGNSAKDDTLIRDVVVAINGIGPKRSLFRGG